MECSLDECVVNSADRPAVADAVQLTGQEEGEAAEQEEEGGCCGGAVPVCWCWGGWCEVGWSSAPGRAGLAVLILGRAWGAVKQAGFSCCERRWEVLVAATAAQLLRLLLGCLVACLVAWLLGCLGVADGEGT